MENRTRRWHGFGLDQPDGLPTAQSCHTGAVEWLEWDPGNTAEKVVRYAGCPGPVVRENEREFVAREPISGNDRKVEAII